MKNKIPLIIKREYLTKVKNKSFIIMTFLTPIIMIGLIALISYLSQLNNTKQRTITILDPSGLVTNLFESNQQLTYNYLTNTTLEQAKKDTEKANYYGLLYLPKSDTLDAVSTQIKFYSKDSPSLSIITNLENTLERKFRDLKLKRSGVDLQKLEQATTNITITQESFIGEKTSKTDSFVKIFFGAAAGYLLFMFIIIYGNMIMRSVIEEKTSRVIEVIISSVKPIQLMLGKIIGTTLAGITQFFIWLLIGGILMTVISAVFGLSMQSPSDEAMQEVLKNSDINSEIQGAIFAFSHLPLANLIIAFIFFFIAGYLLYSSLYAAIGASVDNETDTQQFLLPVIMPLIVAVYIGMFTVIEDPHGIVSTIFSYIPFTSPVVMLMRIPFGVPIWQQLISFVILTITFVVIVWFAAKIYRVGILVYGKKPSFKEVLKWTKY